MTSLKGTLQLDTLALEEATLGYKLVESKLLELDVPVTREGSTNAVKAEERKSMSNIAEVDELDET
jgi:hypothetical protein